MLAGRLRVRHATNAAMPAAAIRTVTASGSRRLDAHDRRRRERGQHGERYETQAPPRERRHRYAIPGDDERGADQVRRHAHRGDREPQLRAQASALSSTMPRAMAVALATIRPRPSGSPAKATPQSAAVAATARPPRSRTPGTTMATKVSGSVNAYRGLSGRLVPTKAPAVVVSSQQSQGHARAGVETRDVPSALARVTDRHGVGLVGEEVGRGEAPDRWEASEVRRERRAVQHMPGVQNDRAERDHGERRAGAGELNERELRRAGEDDERQRDRAEIGRPERATRAPKSKPKARRRGAAAGSRGRRRRTRAGNHARARAQHRIASVL